MPPILRPYQIDLIEKTRLAMLGGCRSILLQSPTGSGKTVAVANMLQTAAAKGMASLFVNHRRELIKQSIITFGDFGVKHGVIAAGFPEDRHALIQIGSIQTLARRYKSIKPPQFILWDECHHLAAGSWSALHAAYPDAFHVGMTATPERLDGTGLGKFFKMMIQGPSVKWLIENYYLVPYKLYAPPSVNISGIHTRMGDFVKSELNAAIDKPTITGDAIQHYLNLASEKRAVVFCVSIEHSKHVVAQFLRAGVEAAHVDAETPTVERDEAVRRFRSGEIKILSNVDLFGEGFDLPSLEVAILLRPTQSVGLFLQQVGRALRPFPGKEYALILDHAGNTARHGLPDEERSWSLRGSRDDREKKTGGGDFVKICPKCFAAQFPGRTECSFCSFVFGVKPREVEQRSGDLVEVDPEEISRRRSAERVEAKTMVELIELGKSRGYKRPEFWAKHVFNARQRKKLTEAAQ